MKYLILTFADTQETTHGVLQELWYKIPSGTIASLQVDSRFPSNPDVVNILQKFDSPFNFHTNYGQRLTAYLQVYKLNNSSFQNHNLLHLVDMKEYLFRSL